MEYAIFAEPGVCMMIVRSSENRVSVMCYSVLDFRFTNSKWMELLFQAHFILIDQVVWLIVA